MEKEREKQREWKRDQYSDI